MDEPDETNEAFDRVLQWLPCKNKKAFKQGVDLVAKHRKHYPAAWRVATTVDAIRILIEFAADGDPRKQTRTRDEMHAEYDEYQDLSVRPQVGGNDATEDLEADFEGDIAGGLDADADKRETRPMSSIAKGPKGEWLDNGIDAGFECRIVPGRTHVCGMYSHACV